MPRIGWGRRQRESCLFTHYLYDEFAGAGSGVKVDEHELLPGAQGGAALDNRNGHTGTLQLSTQMRMAVILSMVAGVVFQFRVGGYEAVPETDGVGPDAGFVFDDHDGSRGVFHEDRGYAVSQSRFGDGLPELFGEVVHLRIAGHGDAEQVCGNGHGLSYALKERRNR